MILFLGFVSSDCSVESNKAPDVFGIENGGVCNTQTSDCTKVIVVGNGFMESHELKCSLVPMLVSTHILTVPMPSCFVPTPNAKGGRLRQPPYFLNPLR